MFQTGWLRKEGMVTARDEQAFRPLSLLWSFAFLSYMLRMNISVAQQYMMPELGLNEIQIGQIFSAFMVGYAIFQVPAGLLGDRYGPRSVLTAAAVIWGVATLLTGVVPGLLARSALASFLSLMILRFLLGVGEAATYPVAARAIASWIPAPKHAFSNAIVIAGSTAGSTFTPPLAANLMHAFGWRPVFYLMSILPFALAVAWNIRSRKWPFARHVASSQNGATEVRSWLALLAHRDVLVLCASYFLDSYVLFIYVFWLYKYLVEVRKFGVLSGGWATSIPFAAASIAVPLLGYASDRLALRLGPRRGRRIVAMGCLTMSALLLYGGASAASPWIALAAIALSVGFLFSTEGCFWATAIELGGPYAGASGGLMNTAGNLGGVVSTLAVPVLIHYFGWFSALASGALLALLGAALWLLMRPAQRPALPS